MKSILAIVLPILAFAVLVTVPLFIWGGQSYSFLINQEKAIASFILVTLELAGIAFSIVIVVFVIIQYAQYVRSRRFVFDGFSNESKLNDALKTPLVLGILAREELVNQFEAIYNELKGYYDNVSQDFEAFAVDELHIQKDPSGNNIGRYVSVDQINTGGMIEDQKEIIRSLKDPKGINLMKLAEEIASKEANNMMAMAGEIAPKEISPILKFIEAVIPPHIIRATGHLQGWRGKPGRVGITFEFVDLGSQRNLMVRTIWRSPDGELNKINNTLTNKMTHYYIELLSPAMHWMALMFLEENLISQVPPINRILNILNIFNIPNTREKRRQARLLALLSLQYFASALQFRAYNSFFIQLAIEHFRRALVKDSSWSLPYLYLANLYSFMALESTGEIYEKLLKESLNLYKQALEHTKETNVNKRPRIIIALALAELASGVKTEDEGLINKAIQKVEIGR